MMINTFKGVAFHIAEAGTVIGQDRDGNDMTVADDTAVFNGPKAWVTQKTYDALKSKIGAKP